MSGMKDVRELESKLCNWGGGGVGFQQQNIQDKEVFYDKRFENLLGAQIPFVHVYTRIPKSAKNITLKLTNKH